MAYKPTKIFLIVSSVLFLAALVPILLLFGNPQWNKWIYIAQHTRMWGLLSDMKPPVVLDEYTGVWVKWYKNGSMSSYGRYVGGKEEGCFRHWSWWPENTLSSEEYYTNGVIQRMYIFYPTGKKKTELNFKDGKKNGVIRGWHKDGAIAFEHEYRNGQEIIDQKKLIINEVVKPRIELTDKLIKQFKMEKWDIEKTKRRIGIPKNIYYEKHGNTRLIYISIIPQNHNKKYRKELTLTFDSAGDFYRGDLTRVNVIAGSDISYENITFKGYKYKDE